VGFVPLSLSLGFCKYFEDTLKNRIPPDAQLHARCFAINGRRLVQPARMLQFRQAAAGRLRQVNLDADRSSQESLLGKASFQ
jgi:hypothetical protein